MAAQQRGPDEGAVPRDVTPGSYASTSHAKPTGGWSDSLSEVLESAALLQKLVPDAVLVGGSAAAMRAQHRESYVHDHVVGDLKERFDMVLEALEAEPEWVTNRVTPGKIILGQIGEIEAGVRQLIRAAPLECEEVELPSGNVLRAPTPEETLRVKAFLVIKRNQVRDYLDVAALADHYGIESAARTLTNIDSYYADQQRGDEAVSTQIARQLAYPRPADSGTVQRLPAYKGLASRWHDWDEVRAVCKSVSVAMIEGGAR